MKRSNMRAVGMKSFRCIGTGISCMNDIFCGGAPEKWLTKWLIKIPVLPKILPSYLPVAIHALIFGTVEDGYLGRPGYPVLVYRVVKNVRYLPVFTTGINTGMPLW